VLAAVDVAAELEQAAMAVELEVDDVGEPFSKRPLFERRVQRCAHLHQLAAGVDVADRGDDRLLVLEVAVERSDRDARALGDAVGGERRLAAFREQTAPRLDDRRHDRPRPLLARLPACARRGARSHGAILDGPRERERSVDRGSSARDLSSRAAALRAQRRAGERE
jgi:hypothetical protein